MRVNAWKNIDVEFEAEVCLTDCINEMIDIANSENSLHRKLNAIDGATRILHAVSPEMVAAHLESYPQSRALIRSRLQKWIEVLTDETGA